MCIRDSINAEYGGLSSARYRMSKHHKKIWYAPNKFEAYGDEEIEAVTKCLKDGWLAPGPKTEEFENKMCALFGKKFGVFVNSGSSANLLILCVAGITHGDEVVTPACTFATTVAPIVQLGAVPVFMDVQVGTYVPTAEDVLAKITDKTAMIMLPNLIGSKPDWKKLREEVDKLNAHRKKKITLFEDSCDTITHTTVTDYAACSFYASHIITCGGGGGIAMFNTKEDQLKALKFRDWGRIGNNTEDMSERFNYSVDGIPYDFKFLYDCWGYNFKSTEMNCAFGLVQLSKLDKFKLIRKQNIQRFIQNLKDVPHIIVPEDRPLEKMEDWLAMPLMYPWRKELLTYLEEHDVQTRVCFAGNITRHPAYRKWFHEYPNSDRIMKEGFLLGAHHGNTLEDVDYVCGLIKSFKPPQK
eukprot:TRINITY_DN897_c0_g1_i1.p1 TRINITY_DN897_c0_g1~~TRINITY_DN897_c0_g1_i1.p1  ORF type:complete len:412 (-),score=82.46 TRINITY_DN897_c0_g1_i1:62-1297(-)